MLPGTSAGSRGSPKHCDNTAADYFVSAFSENRALSAEQEETSLANADQVSTPRRVARRAGGRTACFRTVPQHGASSQLRLRISSTPQTSRLHLPAPSTRGRPNARPPNCATKESRVSLRYPADKHYYLTADLAVTLQATIRTQTLNVRFRRHFG
jgi:hypothetical protein